MHPIDLMHLGTEKVIATWEVDGVLIDPGPESCLETLLAGRESDEPPRAILLTHIHFDHAGATGAILRRWPDVPVYVHELGAHHLADPERLVTSATRLYGEDGMKRLWGEVVPVPEANLHVLSGGERVLDDTYRVEYTPGHASHHVSYLHEPSGRAFVGDMAGVTVPPGSFVLAPTPPPDVDLDAWERSLRVIEGWAPAGLALTHFGAIDDVPAQLASVRAALAAQAALAAEHDLEGFVAAMREKLAREAPEMAVSYAQAAPLEHLWLGLDRWRSKLEKAKSPG
jgi:glyoxylase-like metal-dependent hydrolase (beta-lactamase superfamily II)